MTSSFGGGPSGSADPAAVGRSAGDSGAGTYRTPRLTAMVRTTMPRVRPIQRNMVRIPWNHAGPKGQASRGLLRLQGGAVNARADCRRQHWTADRREPAHPTAAAPEIRILIGIFSSLTTGRSVFSTM